MTLAPLSVSGCLPAGNPANSPVSADAGAFPFTVIQNEAQGCVQRLRAMQEMPRTREGRGSLRGLRQQGPVRLGFSKGGRSWTSRNSNIGYPGGESRVIAARGGHSSALALSRAGRASSRHLHSGHARFRAGRPPASSLFETGRGFGPGPFYGSAISASRITGRQVMNRKESSQAQMGPTHITLFEQAQAFCKPWAREDCATARAARVSA